MTFRFFPLLTCAVLCLCLLQAGAAQTAPQAPVLRAAVPAGTEAELVQAADMINAGDLIGAHEVLNRAYHADAKNALVLYLEGVVQFKGGAYGDAAGSAAAAIGLDKTVGAYYYLRGVGIRYNPDMFQLDVQRATADDFKTAYTLDPMMAAAFRERASATLYLTKLEPNYTPWYDGTVYSDISTALRLDPNDAEAHFIEGVENIADSDWQSAHDDLAQAAALGINRSEVFEDLGYVEYHLKHNAQAATYYQKALDIDPNNITAKQNLAALQSGGDVTWLPQTVDPWTQRMRDLYASYQGDAAAANAISDGGRAPGYGSADDYDSDEEDPGAAPCNRASAWWKDLHDAGLVLGQMITMARSDDTKKIYGDWLISNAGAEAVALKTWQADGCTNN